MSGNRPTALVLRALGLGAFFAGLPALALLREALPEHGIVLAVPPEFDELARLSGTVDITTPAHELSTLHRAPWCPDLAIDLHGNGPESRALLSAREPQHLIAYGIGDRRWDAQEHEVHRWCRLVAEGLGLADVTSPSVVGRLPVPDGASLQAGQVVVHCGAKSASRRWPADRFAAVAGELAGRGCDVVVTAGAHEVERGQEIARRAGVGLRADLSLPDLLRLVAGAALVVSGDTGVAHVATNYATPSVVLFGLDPPAVWGPPADPRHQVLWHADGLGDPPDTLIDPALRRITVDEVLQACDRAVGASARQRGNELTPP